MRFIIYLLCSISLVSFHANAVAQDSGSFSLTEIYKLEASRNGGFESLARTESAIGQTTKVFFATNRNALPESAPTSFGLVIQKEVRFGEATLVAEQKLWQLKSISVERSSMSDALVAAEAFVNREKLQDFAKSFEAFGGGANTPIKNFAEFASRPGTDVLVYVHGAAHDFASALSTAARIKELYAQPGREMIILVFTYPTNGRSNPFDYLEDRRDAGMSGHAMSAAFSRLLNFLGEVKRTKLGGRTFLMTHSLGSYASRIAVKAITERTEGIEKVFDFAFLLAADEDDDTLSDPGKMKALFRLSFNVAVYFAHNDLLLIASKIANWRTPIGLYGPDNVEGEKFEGGLQAIDAADCSLSEGDTARHRYYLGSQCVIDDIKSVLLMRPADRIDNRIRMGTRSFRLRPKGN